MIFSIILRLKMIIFNQYPSWVLFIDYFLGFIMWLLIVGFCLNLLFTEETKVKVIKYYFSFINKLELLLNKIIPSFIPKPIVSIYLAWVIFTARFYILPVINGFDAIGYLSFPFERLFIEDSYISDLFQNI